MQVPDYANFVQAVAGRGNPDAAFEALCEFTKELVGVKLFTVMSRDAEQRVSRRVYSNMPDVYPVSGTKPANETDWSRQVIQNHKTFVANDIDAIAAVFSDYELIQSLGCESVMNVPVIIAGEVLGTVNCLHDAGYYTEHRVAAADALKLPGAICILLNKLNYKENL